MSVLVATEDSYKVASTGGIPPKSSFIMNELVRSGKSASTEPAFSPLTWGKVVGNLLWAFLPF